MRRATELSRGAYWLHTWGSDLDNADMARALLNAPKPIRTEGINVTTNLPDPLVTEGEAARILRVSLTSLRRWRPADAVGGPGALPGRAAPGDPVDDDGREQDNRGPDGPRRGAADVHSRRRG